MFADMGTKRRRAPSNFQLDHLTGQARVFQIPLFLGNIALYPIGASSDHIKQHPSWVLL
jgi:hypothetical protein